MAFSKFIISGKEPTHKGHLTALSCGCIILWLSLKWTILYALCWKSIWHCGNQMKIPCCMVTCNARCSTRDSFPSILCAPSSKLGHPTTRVAIKIFSWGREVLYSSISYCMSISLWNGILGENSAAHLGPGAIENTKLPNIYSQNTLYVWECRSATSPWSTTSHCKFSPFLSSLPPV